MKQFKILLAAVVAIALAAWFASRQEDKKFETAEQELFLPELGAQLAQLDKVRVHPAGQAPLTLTPDGDIWRLAERDGYPVDTQVLRRELRKLAEARTLEAKTRQPDFYARLGVQDLAQAEDTTVQLTAYSDDSTLAELLIGKSGKGGSYVRKVGAEQSWLLDTTIKLPPGAAAWLDKDLVDIERKQLQSVAVQPREGPDYQLSKASEEDALTLEPAAPDGREVNVANINRLGAALSRLRIQDVVSQPPEDLQWAAVRYSLFNGLQLDLRVAKQDSERFLQISASSSDEADDEVQAEVERINALAEGRTYAMSQYAVDAMSMSYEMLLKQPPEAEAE